MTMKDTKNVVALISLGVLTIGSFITSKIYDKKVDKEIQEHEEKLKRDLQARVDGLTDSIPKHEVEILDDDGNVVDWDKYWSDAEFEKRCDEMFEKRNEKIIKAFEHIDEEA